MSVDPPFVDNAKVSSDLRLPEGRVLRCYMNAKRFCGSPSMNHELLSVWKIGSNQFSNWKRIHKIQQHVKWLLSFSRCETYIHRNQLGLPWEGGCVDNTSNLLWVRLFEDTFKMKIQVSPFMEWEFWVNSCHLEKIPTPEWNWFHQCFRVRKIHNQSNKIIKVAPCEHDWSVMSTNENYPFLTWYFFIQYFLIILLWKNL